MVAASNWRISLFPNWAELKGDETYQAREEDGPFLAKVKGDAKQGTAMILL